MAIDPAPFLNTKDKKAREQLSTISETLLILEVSTLHVGIPFLRLNEERLRRRDKFSLPLDDFVRVNLVSVSTPVLNQYIETISGQTSSPYCEQIKEDLRKGISCLDYLYLAGLSFLVAFTSAFFCVYHFSYDSSDIMLTCLAAGLGASFASLICFLDALRLSSFSRVLQQELDRRHGKFGSYGGISLPVGSLNLDIQPSKETCMWWHKENTLYNCLLICFLLAFSIAPPGIASSEEKEEEPAKAIGENDTLVEGQFFECSFETFYSWKKDAGDQVVDVFFETNVARGKNKLAIKTELQSKFPNSLHNAQTECNRQHSAAQCMKDGLVSMTSDLRSLDFQSRRSLRSTMRDACDEKKGVCLSSRHTDIECKISSSPDGTPVKVEEKIDVAENDKKKKKK